MEENKRLFVGLPVSDALRKQLPTLQPAGTARVRPLPLEQLHLTLHFIGQAVPEVVGNALEGIEGPALELKVERLGHFGSPRRGGILWVGIEKEAALIALHAAVGKGLSRTGRELEARPFIPHITLARCRAGTPSQVFDDFLKQDLPALAPLSVGEFVLYSSDTQPGGPVYSPERHYPLR